MDHLYIAVAKLTSDGIMLEERMNTEFKLDSVYEQVEFAFQALYCDDKYFQLKVQVVPIADLGGVIPLPLPFEFGGFRVGGKYGVPILIDSYIFVVSPNPILWNDFYRFLGIDINLKTISNNYEALTNRIAHSEKLFGFLELMNYTEKNTELSDATNKMVSQTCVYTENFRSNLVQNKNGKIEFQENSTILSAEKTASEGKHTAILNFANPVEPGGGVLRGADAQEENVCRVSNLYKSLTSEKAGLYYRKNKDILSKNQFNSMFLGTNDVIYSPHVMILKEEGGYRYREQYFSVDIITAAAPFFSGSGYILPNGDLQYLLEKKIRNILEAAIENDVDVLILGAFGCGAFHNPPDVVADSFREVLLEKKYKKAFDEVVFAVKRSDVICSNIEAFERNFSCFPEINYHGNEKQHRDNWRWKCECDIEHSWTAFRCNKCGIQRSNFKKMICYSE